VSSFEYLSVLISIVLGLGITQLLLGFARWLEQRDSVRVYGPVFAWAFFLLLLHIQTWWSMFGSRSQSDWNILQFSSQLLTPILLYLQAVLVFPTTSAPSGDLRSNFYRQRRWFFGLLVGVVVISLLRGWMHGVFPSGVNLAFHIGFLAFSIVGMVLRNERLHAFLPYGAIIVFLVYIAVLFANL
jgi:hypothetical protein